MKERLLPAAFALAALGLFWLLMFPKPGQRADQAARPLSTERAPAGYLALARWLEIAHVPVSAWRARFERLAGPQAMLPARTGNLMIVSLPFENAARLEERQAFDAWLREGNTVLVMAALDDTPPWALMPSGEFNAQLQQIAHLGFETIEPPESLDSDKDRIRAALEATVADKHVDLRPVVLGGGTHPMFTGVTTLATHSELPASRWRATARDGAAVLEVAHRQDSGDPAIWVRSLGKGTIIVCGYASPLSNEMIGTAGNARWLANLVATYVGPGGRVVFDDSHQGGLDYYDPSRFFGDARLHRALGWLLLLWAFWVLGTRALLPARDATRRVDDTALLGVTADFYAGALSPAVAGERLCAHFFDSIRRRCALPENGQPVWDWLAGHARVDPIEIAELQRLHARALAGRRLDLVRLHALLHDLSGKIA